MNGHCRLYSSALHAYMALKNSGQQFTVSGKENQYGTCPNGQVGQKVNVEPCGVQELAIEDG